MNEVAEHQRLWRQLDNACRLGSNPDLPVTYHQAVHEVAGHRLHGRCRCPLFEGAMLFVQDIHTPQRSHQQPSAGRDSQCRSIVVRQRMDVGCMAECRQGAGILVVGIQPQVRCYPHRVAAFQQVGHVQPLQLCNSWSNVTAYQRRSAFRQAVQAAVDVNPYGTVMFDVADVNVGRVTTIVALADVCHASCFVESIAEYAITRHVPHGTLCIAIHLDGILCQPAAEVYAGHRPHVNYRRALVEGHP